MFEIWIEIDSQGKIVLDCEMDCEASENLVECARRDLSARTIGIRILQMRSVEVIEPRPVVQPFSYDQTQRSAVIRHLALSLNVS